MFSMTHHTGMAFIGCAAACLLNPHALADVIHVHPGQSIQTAIANAQPHDEIIVHPGDYEEALDTLGKPLHLHSADGADLTIINAAQLNTHAVTCTSNETADTVIEGFTITGGDAPQGGGMLIANASPTVTDCVFLENHAEYGAGAFNNHGAPAFTRCRFERNTAEASGGGLYNIHYPPESSATLIECAFTENAARDAGGAMRNWDSAPDLTDCAFTSNTVRYFGAAIANGGQSSPDITRCSFQWNRADTLFTNVDAHGGAVANTHASSPTFINCAFEGNSAHAMLPWLSFGGAVSSIDDAQPAFINCTMLANLADIGDALHADADALVSVANSILWSSPDPIAVMARADCAVSFSIIQNGWPGPGNIAIDPQLLDLIPQPGSPCIDAGDNSIPQLASITLDLNLNPRFVDDPDTPDTGFGDPPLIDIGACERQPIPCPWDTTTDGNVGLGDLNALLSNWGPCPAPCPFDFAPEGGDETVGLGDLNALLSNWGPCP
jgi:hypothetical protein